MQIQKLHKRKQLISIRMVRVGTSFCQFLPQTFFHKSSPLTTRLSSRKMPQNTKLARIAKSALCDEPVVVRFAICFDRRVPEFRSGGAKTIRTTKKHKQDPNRKKSTALFGACLCVLFLKMTINREGRERQAEKRQNCAENSLVLFCNGGYGVMRSVVYNGRWWYPVWE